MDRRQFARLVRQGLAHLYDPAYLQRHPLTAALAPGVGPEAGAQAVHRLLLEAIGSLRPPPKVRRTEASWRPYLVLSLRYLEGLDRAQVAEEAGVSPRQFRREQLKGLAAVTDLLWTRYQQLQGTADFVELRRSLLNAEVARLGTAPTGANTSLPSVVQGVLDILATVAARQQVSVAAALPPDLPAVTMERVALRQVLLNVLSYILERRIGGSVRMTARPTGQEVGLVIRCQAIGEALPRACSEDDRVVVAAHLLEAQGGRMSVCAKGNLSIHLSLPTQRPPTVLVIDDNPDVIQLFQRYLGGNSYQVVGATNGREGLRLAQDVCPQAITLDVMMASQDGWDLLQSLKSHAATRDIPVIVCSVLRERNLALSLGAADFLAKPVTQQELLTTLTRCTADPGAAGRPGLP